MPQLFRPMLFIHDRGQQPGIRAVYAQAVIDDTRSIILNHCSKESDRTAETSNLKTISATLRRGDFEEAGFRLVAAGGNGLLVAADHCGLKLTAIRLPQEVNIHPREL